MVDVLERRGRMLDLRVVGTYAGGGMDEGFLLLVTEENPDTAPESTDGVDCAVDCVVVSYDDANWRRREFMLHLVSPTPSGRALGAL